MQTAVPARATYESLQMLLFISLAACQAACMDMQKQHQVDAPPRSMMVAVPSPPFQHSPTFGHMASSHTVFSLRSRKELCRYSNRSPWGARCRSHGGLACAAPAHQRLSSIWVGSEYGSESADLPQVVAAVETTSTAGRPDPSSAVEDAPVLQPLVLCLGPARLGSCCTAICTSSEKASPSSSAYASITWCSTEVRSLSILSLPAKLSI